MSHKRSFQYMSREELEIKLRFDRFRKEILEKGAKGMLQDYGWGGLDEAMYIISNSLIPGERHRKINYFQGQIQQDEQELGDRGRESLDDRVSHIIATEINPATFFTLKEERNRLKRARIMQMAEEHSEQLYPSERFQYGRAKASSAFDGFTDSLGSVGEFVHKNILWLFTAGALALTLWGAPRWIQSSKVYDDAAHRYAVSSEFGPDALVIKRDIPDLLGYALVDLVHTDEVEIQVDDDTTITIPEKFSNPQGAMVIVIQAEGMLKDTLPYAKINTYEIPQSEKQQIIDYLNSAGTYFDVTWAGLSGQTDTTQTYSTQIGLIGSAEIEMSGIVQVLESHMDPNVVASENHANNILTLWKIVTLAGASGTLLLGWNAIKKTEGENGRDRYYS